MKTMKNTYSNAVMVYTGDVMKGKAVKLDEVLMKGKAYVIKSKPGYTFEVRDSEGGSAITEISKLDRFSYFTNADRMYIRAKAQGI